VLFSFFALFFGTLAHTVPAIPQSFISKLPTTCCLLFQSKWWNLHSVRLLPFLSQPIPVEGMHYSPPWQSTCVKTLFISKVSQPSTTSALPCVWSKFNEDQIKESSLSTLAWYIATRVLSSHYKRWFQSPALLINVSCGMKEKHYKVCTQIFMMGKYGTISCL